MTTSINTAEKVLKKCPFCGGGVKIVYIETSKGFWRVECKQCSAQMVDSYTEVIINWNKRI